MKPRRAGVVIRKRKDYSAVCFSGATSFSAADTSYLAGPFIPPIIHCLPENETLSRCG